jgi:hypothetical protein
VLNRDPTTDANEPSVASIGGTPYVVWDDESNGGDEVLVARWTGAAWSLVGDALNPGEASLGPVPRIADVGGAPFVAWSEQGSVDLVRVSQFVADLPGRSEATADPGGATPPSPLPAPRARACARPVAAHDDRVQGGQAQGHLHGQSRRRPQRRGSVTVASGAGRLSRGTAKLKLSARRRLKPGRYTLVIKAGEATIVASAVRIGR